LHNFLSCSFSIHREVLPTFSSTPPERYFGFSFSFFGSSFIPHFGHLPGLSCKISGCMGQVYIFAPGLAVAAGDEAGLVCANAGIATLKIARQINVINFFMILFGLFWFLVRNTTPMCRDDGASPLRSPGA